MLTVADIEGQTLAPLSDLVAAADVPGDLAGFAEDAGDLLAGCRFTDATFQPVENGFLGDVVLVLDREIALAPFGDAVQLLLAPAGDLTVCRVQLALEARPGGFAVGLTVLDVAVVVRVDGAILRPLLPGTTEPDPRATSLDVVLGSATLRLATERPVEVEFTGAAAVPRCMIGATGIIASAGGLRWLTPGSEDLPGGTPADFAGPHLQDVVLELASLELAPDAELRIDSAFVGRGGVTADVALEGLDLAGSLAGFAFTLDSLDLTVVQNGVTGSAVAGTLQVPFFEQPVDVAVSLSGDGGLHVSLAGQGPDGLAELAVPGLGTLGLTGLGLDVSDGDAQLLLSGRLEVTAGAPTLQWPIVALRDLGVDTAGHVTLAGGWLVLQEPLALDLYGFGIEITRVGFGTEEDGRRWFGVDGAVRLTELLPAGASARGLRVTWDPDRPDALPQLTLDGIGVTFGVPDAFGFTGEVALADDPNGDGKLFTGALALGLDALDVGIDAGITIGHDAAATYVFVNLGVEVPIPVAATGTALYGLEGLFAMNMAPLVATGAVDADGSTVQRGDWYGWYKYVPQPFSVTDPTKWSPSIGSWAFGAGLSLGTLPDAGFSVNTKALLVVLLPGPVILLQGTADLLKVPAAFRDGATDEGTFGLLAALDGRAATLELGIDASWSVPRILDITASTDAFFDFDRRDAWHVWVGRDEPESLRIGADVLALFHADSWLMLDSEGIATGLSVSWGDSWRFGPVALTLSSWIAARASLTRRPSQLVGGLGLGGEAAISAGPFGIGLSVSAALDGASFTPYHVSGTLSVAVGLPFPLKDLDVDIELDWSQPQTPELEDPWVGAIVQHERCTESWRPVQDGTTSAGADEDAPVVPLDAGVLLSFAQPMGDDGPIADNPPAATPVTTIGEHDASYTLASLRLHRRRRSQPDAGWEDITDSVVATWTPDAGEAGSRLQLFARSPFAFTRSTSRRWVDSFLDARPTWPCSPEPSVGTTCIDWNGLPRDVQLPRIWERGGATLSSEAPLHVQGADGGRSAIRLQWGPAPDGTPQPGLLWVGLPEPAAEVTMEVEVSSGDWTALRGWAGNDQVAVDLGLPGTVGLRVTGAGMDSVTLGWGFNVEPLLFGVCWTPQAAVDANDAWRAGQDRLEVAADRWSSEEPILEPDSHYLLEVETGALLTKGGAEVQRLELSHAVQFQTGGPPGIVPDWLDPPPSEASAAAPFPYGGVLADLAAYVRWSIPDPGAVPVFRAYDLGCEFDADCVQQMYGADLGVRVVDADGDEVVFDNAWAPAPVKTLTTSEASWLQRLDACTGAGEGLELAADDQLRVVVPALLWDDFSGAAAVRWVTRVLDPAETRAAHWHVDGGVLLQDVDVAGGTRGPHAPDKPGTVYVGVDVAAADVAVETFASATSGAFGLVFRWRGNGDYYRFSVERRSLRLVRVADGIVRELWSAPDSYEPGLATRLAVQAQGARIRGQVDDRLVCDVLEPALGAAAPGAVGLYTWDSDNVAFDEVLARTWPGPALAPERPYAGELVGSRPLFVDAFDDLGAFEPVVLATGGAASGSSASGGSATITSDADDKTVAALSGDPAAADYVVEGSARPDGAGAFGVVARHAGPDHYLALSLEPGSGRSLVEHARSGAEKVLWQDAAEVEVGATYSLGLRCEGSAVAASIDDEEFTATTELGAGRFGMLSAIAAPGCAFTNLVVRSAPPTAVYRWNFTTSRYLGLPDLLDTFAGVVWPIEGADVDGVALASEATAGQARLAAADGEADSARAVLAAAVAAGDAVEVTPLVAAARSAMDFAGAESESVYDLLVGALGTPWRPTPPIVEMSAVASGQDVVALLVDLPEPLPWERIRGSLLAPDGTALSDLVLARSGDGARVVLVRAGARPFAAGTWALELSLRLDVGAERAVWRRAGSTAPEAGRLAFSVGPS